MGEKLGVCLNNHGDISHLFLSARLNQSRQMAAHHRDRFCSRFLPVKHSFFFFFSSLAAAACSWGKSWVTVNNQGVWSIPAQFGKFHKMTFVVNWHYINKDWLTVETQNRYHQVKPWCFLNHNQEVFVRKPNQSISTASWQERNRTLDPNKSKIVT